MASPAVLTLHITREDVFNAAVQGCQPLTIAVERNTEQQGGWACAAMANYDTIHVYIYGLRRVLILHVPESVAAFNRAFWRSEIITLDQDLYVELTDAEEGLVR